MALSIAELAPQDEKLQLLLGAINSAWGRVSNSFLITEDQVQLPSKADEESGGEGSEDEEDEEDEQSEDENPRSEERSSNQQTPGSKRLRQRYAYCDNCEKEFDVTQNTKTSCRYHTDSCYPDGDFFVDDDYYDNGEYDNGEALEEYPEGYIYECCERRANEEPCTVSRHRERVSIKRQRV
ncbi:hypothetical protein BDV39DRAFT_205757 [Aspergillus sergii]|uniref:C2H2-type domain-containing protein n=1 Tax=Aspergillus sergii TaxID=1034303 RepID=A0A5N6X076_9EURO|nr:hypothetical protein BDV39DRAFT_205757 [Aspergillus sergii]